MFKKVNISGLLHTAKMTGKDVRKPKQKKQTKRGKKFAQKKQMTVKTPKQQLTQVRHAVGQKFQERVATPTQIKSYNDSSMTERIRRATS
jgi:hypothetical protein